MSRIAFFLSCVILAAGTVYADDLPKWRTGPAFGAQPGQMCGAMAPAKRQKCIAATRADIKKLQADLAAIKADADRQGQSRFFNCRKQLLLWGALEPKDMDQVCLPLEAPGRTAKERGQDLVDSIIADFSDQWNRHASDRNGWAMSCSFPASSEVFSPICDRVASMHVPTMRQFARGMRRLAEKDGTIGSYDCNAFMKALTGLSRETIAEACRGI